MRPWVRFTLRQNIQNKHKITKILFWNGYRPQVRARFKPRLNFVFVDETNIVVKETQAGVRDK